MPAACWPSMGGLVELITRVAPLTGGVSPSSFCFACSMRASCAALVASACAWAVAAMKAISASRTITPLRHTWLPRSSLASPTCPRRRGGPVGRAAPLGPKGAWAGPDDLSSVVESSAAGISRGSPFARRYIDCCPISPLAPRSTLATSIGPRKAPSAPRDLQRERCCDFHGSDYAGEVPFNMPRHQRLCSHRYCLADAERR